MSARLRGMEQGSRTASDGISMLQVADGALAGMNGNLQRIRELAVQAATASTSASDKAALQQEVAQLIGEVDRVGVGTEFNGSKVSNNAGASVFGDINQVAVMRGLQGGWLENAEQMLATHCGLSGDGAARSIELTTFTDGGNAPFHIDRIIAHEMAHAVMARSMNWANMQNHVWFLEGSAEFIHGADERIATDLAAAGGAGNEQALVNEVGNGWGGSSADCSGSCAAVRFLHPRIKAVGATASRM